MPGNYPEENIQHTEHGKSLRSRTDILFEDCTQRHKIHPNIHLHKKSSSSCTDHSRSPAAMTFIWYSIRICGTNLHMHVALTNLLSECFELIHMRCQSICYCSIITYQSDVMTVQILDIFPLFLDAGGLLLQHSSFSSNLGNF
jgi:hypothetical protein